MDITDNTVCDQISPYLDAYHDAELPVSEQARIESHLLQCAQCAKHLADISRVVQTLKDLPQSKPSPTFSANLDKLIDDQNKVVPFKPRVLVPMTAAAAILALVIGVKYWTPLQPDQALSSHQNSGEHLHLLHPQRTIEPPRKPNPSQIDQRIATGIKPEASVPATNVSPKQSINSATTQPVEAPIIAELPGGNQNSFNDAVGIATDEDGLYELKM